MPKTSQLPFGFRTKWDGHRQPHAHGAVRRRLNCLSAFERSGTAAAGPPVRRKTAPSQLPFGFRTKWDVEPMATGTKSPTSVSIAFRLSNEVGHAPKVATFAIPYSGLNCLSAFERSGTRRRGGHRRRILGARLNCLSAFERSGTLSHFRPDFKRISNGLLHNCRFQGANKGKTVDFRRVWNHTKHPSVLGAMRVCMIDAIFGALVWSCGQATMAAGGSAGRTVFPDRRIFASHVEQSG